MNTNVKIFGEILANIIHQHIKRIKHYNKGFIPEMQGFLSISKSINVTHHINKLNKNHMIISIAAEKLLTKSNTYL